jgi:hypothetical protein
MSAIFINSLVRLTRDVPLSSLHRGDVGVVQSRWFGPDGAYEVEFRVPGHEYPIRTVLQEFDFRVEPHGPDADVEDADAPDAAYAI